MRRRRSVAVAALACLALALGLSSCGGHHRHPRTATRTLSIYTSLPFEGLYATEAQAVYDAEKLALAQTGGLVDGYKVVLKSLDDAAPGAASDSIVVGDRARTAAADPGAIAYLGELTPGSSLGSIGILSPAGILQVSPGDTATGLAGRTFARVVPPDSDEALAQLSSMRRLGVKRLYIVADKSIYGQDIAGAALSDAQGGTIDVVDPKLRYLRADPSALVRAIKRSRADALLYAGGPGASVAPLWNALTAAGGTIRKFASAAVTLSPSWGQIAAPALYDTYLSAPGLPSRGLPRAGLQFEQDFIAAYGSRIPWASGIFGYVAMNGVLAALHSLPPRVPNPRARLAAAYLHLSGMPSALGTYSIVGGQTSFHNYFFTTYSRSGVAESYSPGP